MGWGKDRRKFKLSSHQVSDVMDNLLARHKTDAELTEI